jgi:hypothetical protein
MKQLDTVNPLTRVKIAVSNASFIADGDYDHAGLENLGLRESTPFSVSETTSYPKDSRKPPPVTKVGKLFFPLQPICEVSSTVHNVDDDASGIPSHRR